MVDKKRCILVVDDEAKMVRALEDYLKTKNFLVLKAQNGVEAINVFCSNIEQIDIVLLDIMMPGMNGIAVLKELREMSFITPVIMITAKGEEYDQLNAFSYGADDYVTKPFSTSLLLARIEAVLRRFGKNSNQKIEMGELLLETSNRQVYLQGDLLDLTRREYDLLFYFATNPSRTFSREYLLDHVWGYSFEGGARTVDTHIRQLRKKLGDFDYIKTIHCVGYRFEV